MLFYSHDNLTLEEFINSVITLVGNLELGRAKVVLSDPKQFGQMKTGLSLGNFSVRQIAAIERIDLVLLNTFNDLRELLDDYYKRRFCVEACSDLQILAFFDLLKNFYTYASTENDQKTPIEVSDSSGKSLNQVLSYMFNLSHYGNIDIFFNDYYENHASSGKNKPRIWNEKVYNIAKQRKALLKNRSKEVAETNTIDLGLILSKWLQVCKI